MSNDPIDIHVGQRIRLARKKLNMSQDKLADALGVTFQQVQKYERGANRVSASMLWRASHAVKEPISYFFDGLEGAIGVSKALEIEAKAVAAYMRIPSIVRVDELTAAQQKALHGIIESMLGPKEDTAVISDFSYSRESKTTEVVAVP
jgi:transcriptional regulator with XRE-family HTH domain